MAGFNLLGKAWDVASKAYDVVRSSFEGKSPFEVLVIPQQTVTSNFVLVQQQGQYFAVYQEKTKEPVYHLLFTTTSKTGTVEYKR